MGNSAGSNTGVQLRVLGTTTVDLNISGIGSVPVSTGQSIVGRWVSIACTKAAGSSAYLIYFNGLAVNGSGALTPNFTNSAFYIGSDQTPTASFNGNIACAGIWNSVLSAAEILAMHNNPSLIQGTPTVFYKMDEGSGLTLTDISGNGNNGTMTSGTTWDGGQTPFGVQAPVMDINSPNDILSPLFYLDSRYGVTNTGGKASAWLDQSPNGISFTQSTDANRPAIVASGINGLQSLSISAAADEFMTATSNFIGAAKEHSLFCIIRGTASGPSAFTGFVTLGSGVAGGQSSTIGLDNTNKFWFGGSGYGMPTITNTIANATTYAIGKGTNGSVTDVYFNAANIFNSFPQIGAYAISPTTDAVIGRYVTGGVGADYYIGVACAWNRRLTDGEWRALFNWAYRVWGVGTYITRSQGPSRVQTTTRTAVT